CARRGGPRQGAGQCAKDAGIRPRQASGHKCRAWSGIEPRGKSHAIACRLAACRAANASPGFKARRAPLRRTLQIAPAVALKATICKVALRVADVDRHYYRDHPLTLARHPSETDERMMLRILAFALHADGDLQFGRGISTDDEPDLWLRDMTGVIERWVDVGQP